MIEIRFTEVGHVPPEGEIVMGCEVADGTYLFIEWGEDFIHGATWLDGLGVDHFASFRHGQPRNLKVWARKEYVKEIA